MSKIVKLKAGLPVTLSKCVYGKDGNNLETTIDKHRSDIDKITSSCNNVKKDVDGLKYKTTVVTSDILNLNITQKDIQGNTIFKCGELSELNFTIIEAISKEVVVKFKSGSEPTSLVLPTKVECVGELNIEPNKNYVLSVLDGSVVMNEWVFSPNQSLCFTSLEDGSCVSFDDWKEQENIFYISRDNRNWEQWDYDTIWLDEGEKVYVKGDNPYGISTKFEEYDNASNFVIEGNVECSGNIMSLLGDDITEIPCIGCFAYLFYGCDGLLSAPELPATKLTGSCYKEMFSDCTSLVNAPSLPATELADYCYKEMFDGCTSLVNAPELPATELTDNCYAGMFYECTSLVNAPALPATKLSDRCYYSMFEECSSLVNAPALPATKLADHCYRSMFYGCTSLVNAPELPATKLAEYCYFTMFCECVSLVDAPKLPATELAELCYYGMFDGCESLDYISIKASEWDEYCCKNWLEGVSSIGTFNKPAFTDIPRGASGIPEGWDVVSDFLSEPLCFTSLQDGSSVAFNDYMEQENVFYISRNKMSWERWDYSEIALNEGEKVYMIGNNPNGVSTKVEERGSASAFVIKGKVECSGNIMSLLGEDITEMPSYACFAYLFNRCKGLVSAPSLPATKLTEGCYQGMFGMCTSLVNAPALPAIKLAESCYNGMFFECISLVNAPTLPATELAESCYCGMFESCSSLVNAPELPATELVDSCYADMFVGCTSLVNAPTLPATELSEYCYGGMFRGCTSLKNIDVKALDWDANTFESWVENVSQTGTFVKSPLLDIPRGINGIPEGWDVVNEFSAEPLCFTSLQDGSTIAFGDFMEQENVFFISRDNVNWEQWDYSEISLDEGDKVYMIGNNPNGLATKYEDEEYASCFIIAGEVECSGNIMSLLGEGIAEIPSRGCFAYLFNDCSGLTTAPYLPAIKLADACYNSMFVDCTSLVNAPELPATELAEDCYYSMFLGCTSLENAPSLPATKLVKYCYFNMFYGCTSLVNAPELPATELSKYCYSGMFVGCSSLVNAPELTATELAEGCYGGMFQGCSSLVSAPALPATKLVNYCYALMFKGCTSLKNVDVKLLDWDANTFKSWVENVSPTGTFVKSPLLYIPRGVNGIPEGWDVENAPLKVEPLCFTSLQDGSTIAFDDFMEQENVFFISRDKSNWERWDYSEIALDKGEKVYVIGNNPNGLAINYEEEQDGSNFVIEGKVECSGNIMSLLGEDITEIPSIGCFAYLFYECEGLMSAPELSSIELTDWCYEGMFNGCASLVNTPSLPATKLAVSCYSGMFAHCTSLVNAPALPATELAEDCYYSMFQGCTSLVNVPSLPATKLADHCYFQMFQGCTSLVNAPELPATRLEYRCYNGMFIGCTSLVNAPELPATELVESCYDVMFRGCNSLKSISVNMERWSRSFTESWVNSVPPGGVFIKPLRTAIPKGEHGIPEGWTVMYK